MHDDYLILSFSLYLRLSLSLFRIIYYNCLHVSSLLVNSSFHYGARLIVGEVSALELFAIRDTGAITLQSLITGCNHERRAYRAYFIIYFRPGSAQSFILRPDRGRHDKPAAGSPSCVSLRKLVARRETSPREELIYTLARARKQRLSSGPKLSHILL